MRKLMQFLAGLGFGASLGAALVAKFAPETGDAFKARLREHYEQAMEAARKASEDRRTELEAELQRIKES